MVAHDTGPIRVRVADLDDLDGVVAVGRAAWPVTYGPILGDDLVEMFLAKWWTPEACAQGIRTGRTLVVEEDGAIAGMCTYGPHTGHEVIWKLYVHPDHHGHGIGAALVDAVVDRVRDTAPALYLSFSDGNAGAERFTQTLGFVDDRREDQGSMPDLVWKRLDLTPRDGDETAPTSERIDAANTSDISHTPEPPEGERA